MARPIFFAIAIASTGALFNTAAEASHFECNSRAANCLGSCDTFTGGAGDFRGHQNKCIVACDRQATACLIRADMRWRREYPWVR
jgi:hypothetical protein